jgi:hypothetical protein
MHAHALVRISRCLVVLALLAVLCLPPVCHASSAYRLSKGQTVYVPVYSNIFSAPRRLTFNLAALLSIRNTDMANPIRVLSADYYDTKGRLVKRYYTRPVILAPLETATLFIPEEDTVGGAGANFIVRWSSPHEVNVPIIECVMTGMKSGQGISFVSPGQEIREIGR